MEWNWFFFIVLLWNVEDFPGFENLNLNEQLNWFDGEICWFIELWKPNFNKSYIHLTIETFADDSHSIHRRNCYVCINTDSMLLLYLCYFIPDWGNGFWSNLSIFKSQFSANYNPSWNANKTLKTKERLTTTTPKSKKET
jgi:hypothetical protein